MVFFGFFLVASSIALCSGKKVACVGTDDISSIPIFEFIRSYGTSIKVFSEPDKFGDVNLKPLIGNPNVFE